MLKYYNFRDSKTCFGVQFMFSHNINATSKCRSTIFVIEFKQQQLRFLLQSNTIRPSKDQRDNRTIYVARRKTFKAIKVTSLKSYANRTPCIAVGNMCHVYRKKRVVGTGKQIQKSDKHQQHTVSGEKQTFDDHSKPRAVSACRSMS